MKLKERAKKLKTDIPALVEITVRLIPKAHGSISLLWQRRWILRSKRRRIGNKIRNFRIETNVGRLAHKPPKSMFNMDIFSAGASPRPTLCGIFRVVYYTIRATTQGRPYKTPIKFCVFTDSRKGCPYNTAVKMHFQ